tara:strand:+ start:2093 stop:3205 length:1113 start_codon:yes stop_codon:yes gene_type:complete
MALLDIANNGLGGLYTGTYASKILLEPMFHSDEIMRNYSIYPNVKFQTNIMMAEKLTDITAINDGCGANTCTGAKLHDMDITQKVLSVKNVSVKQEQCWNEFEEEVIRESYRNGVNMPDLSGTDLANLIIKRVSQGIKHDTIRNMWAGDFGLIGNVVNCSYASMGDGLWESLRAVGAPFAGAGLTEYTATGTAAANLIAVGATIAPVDAELLLRSVFDAAPAELQQTAPGEKRMFVTPNIYNAYYGALTAVSPAVGSVDYGHSEAQTGVNYPRLHFRGVEVVPMYEWDVAFTALAAAPPALFTTVGATQSTQGCIYAAKSNLIIGTDTTSPDTQLKMFYDNVGENMLIKAYFTMGFQFGWNSLVTGGMLA